MAIDVQRLGTARGDHVRVIEPVYETEPGKRVVAAFDEVRGATLQRGEVKSAHHLKATEVKQLFG